jgi:hypothetical protein
MTAKPQQQQGNQNGSNKAAAKNRKKGPNATPHQLVMQSKGIQLHS